MDTARGRRPGFTRGGTSSQGAEHDPRAPRSHAVIPSHKRQHTTRGRRVPRCRPATAAPCRARGCAALPAPARLLLWPATGTKPAGSWAKEWRCGARLASWRQEGWRGVMRAPYSLLQ